MTVTTNDRGQQNLFAKEPQMYVSQTDAERYGCLLYTSPSPRDLSTSRMPSSA